MSLLTQEKIKLERKVPGENQFTVHAVLTLTGGLILMMVAGLPYAFGNIIPYIVSYFRMYRRYNVDYDTFFPMTPLTEIVSSIVYPYANYLVVKRFSERSRPSLIIGAVIGVSLLILAIVLKVNPYLFIVMYALGTGLIKGFNK